MVQGPRQSPNALVSDIVGVLQEEKQQRLEPAQGQDQCFVISLGEIDYPTVGERGMGAKGREAKGREERGGQDSRKEGAIGHLRLRN